MDRERKIKEAEQLSRVQMIYRHPVFQGCLEKNREAEEMRIFCVHDMKHFLDVARLAYIFSLERGYELAKEEIYAASFLHDIGKWRQYKEKIPHEQASAEFAEEILKDTGFAEAERERILEAILKHRGESKEAANGSRKAQLAQVLYDADKISRTCYACPAEKECNWSEEKKNHKITW